MIKSGELESIPGRSLRYAAYRLPGSAQRRSGVAGED